MRSIALAAALAALAFPALHAAAADPALEKLLKSADLQYETDDDGDYKVVVEWDKEKRSQLVYLSGNVEELGGMRIYTAFSPAHVFGDAGIDAARARQLLQDNAKYKIGGWEIAGKNLYFSTKFPTTVSAAQLHALVVTTAELADNMELDLTPGKDDL